MKRHSMYYECYTAMLDTNYASPESASGQEYHSIFVMANACGLCIEFPSQFRINLVWGPRAGIM